ncbi:hypothetical protein ABZY01_24245 [Streptomyces anthocyanicus]|uniref:hypothetical protein n=1 Tax=Streptomyces TaxID=1883 RepID=UPI0029B65270|nr:MULTISPECIES: hypothetical protein [unclassified Streptomyces]MDX3366580.1 hypothetical protein [Streptomyces sp. ME02-6987-2C]MDX3425550.1 hypothetical protein [Streptomyces sp. ME02-6985-2c]
MRCWSACSGVSVILSPVGAKVGALRTLRPDVPFLHGLAVKTRLAVSKRRFRPEYADGPGSWA